MKKTLALVLTAASAVTALSGCGSKKTGTTTQIQTTVEQTTAAGETTAVGGASTSAGTLKSVATTGDGSMADDKTPTPWYNRIVMMNLTHRALFLADNTLTGMALDLADTYIVNDDGLIYTITLKDGLKWSNGQDLTVDDVQSSIETGLKVTTINSIYTTALGNIKDVKTDGNTITLTLSESYATMLNVLAQSAILPKYSLEGTGPSSLESDLFWTNPIASGMYVLDKLSVGSYFILEWNKNYEGTAPRTDKIICYFVSDYMAAAQAGNADYVFGNATDLVGALQGMSSFTAHEVDVLFYRYLIFNAGGIDGNENPAIQNVEVRKVIMETTDHATLATPYPNTDVLNSDVPNSSPAYNGFEYKFDAEKVRTDLVASGHGMNRTLKICYYNSDQTSIDLINTVVYCLEQVGLRVEATLSNDGITDLFITRAYDTGLKGKSAFFIDEWYTEYMSSDGLFVNVFGGDTDFDSLVTDLSKAVGESSRNEILKKSQDMEQEKVYKVPVFTVNAYILINNNVTILSGVESCNPPYTSGLGFTNQEVK